MCQTRVLILTGPSPIVNKRKIWYMQLKVEEGAPRKRFAYRAKKLQGHEMIVVLY